MEMKKPPSACDGRGYVYASRMIGAFSFGDVRMISFLQACPFISSGGGREESEFHFKVGSTPFPEERLKQWKNQHRNSEVRRLALWPGSVKDGEYHFENHIKSQWRGKVELLALIELEGRCKQVRECEECEFLDFSNADFRRYSLTMMFSIGHPKCHRETFSLDPVKLGGEDKAVELVTEVIARWGLFVDEFWAQRFVRIIHALISSLSIQ